MVSVALLPNGRQQFKDTNGNPLVGGTVGMYTPATLTPKTTYSDSLGLVPNTNPIVLDGLGSAAIWGSGYYRQIVKDSSGNLIWDSVTMAPILEVTGTGLILDTVAALQASQIDSSVNSLWLSGYYSVGDGGGGQYVKASISGAGPGKVRSADGQWWILTAVLPNVLQFGAKGDGITDDALAFNNALLFSPTLLLPKPATFYLIGTTIVFPSGAQITGEAGVIVKAKANFGDISLFQNKTNNPVSNTARDSNIYFDGFTIDGNSANNATGTQFSHCINCQAIQNLRVGPGMILQNTKGDGVYFGPSTASQAIGSSFGSVEAGLISGVARNGVSVTCGDNISVTAKRITGCLNIAVDLEPNNTTNYIRDINIAFEEGDNNGSTTVTPTIGVSGDHIQIFNVIIKVQTIRGQTGPFVQYRGAVNLDISGGYWTGSVVNGIEETAGGFGTGQSYDVRVHDLTIDGCLSAFASRGLAIRLTLANSFKSLNATQTSGGAINLNGPNVNPTVSCQVFHAADKGIYIDGNPTGLNVIGALVDGAPVGIRVGAVTYGRIMGCVIINCTSRGIEETAGDHNLFVLNTLTNDTTGVSLSGANSQQWGNLGFTPPAVTGSRGANDALASLLTELASEQIITDTTTI